MIKFELSSGYVENIQAGLRMDAALAVLETYIGALNDFLADSTPSNETCLAIVEKLALASANVEQAIQICVDDIPDLEDDTM